MRRWIAPAAILLLLGLLAAAWQWTPLREWAHPDRWTPWIEPYRNSPLALPVTLAVFVVLELVLFPVLVLVFLCGVVFGPWLGSLYALAGCLASGAVSYAIGRRLGRERLEHWGGRLVRSLRRKLEKRGIVAVFLVRKVPAPYTLVNLVIGASPISFRDFMIGTFLGMGVGVVLITILGGHVVSLFHQPDAGSIALTAAAIAVPLAIALLLQRHLNRRAEEAP